MFRGRFSTPGSLIATTFPSDHGFLDPEDLGEELARALGPEPLSSAKRDVAAVEKPAVTDTRTRKYRLKMPEPVKSVLCQWRWAVRFTKNAAIEKLNSVTDLKDRLVASNGPLFTLLCNNSSDFVKSHPFLATCPSYARLRRR